MQLPFTVGIEHSDLAKLRSAGCSKRAWTIAVGITAFSGTGIAISREAPRNTKAESASRKVKSVSVVVIVEVDGQVRGHTPPSTTFTPAKHRIAARSDVYAEATYVITARAGESVKVDADLRLGCPPTAWLRPSYPGANITDTVFPRDGRVALTTPLPPGDEHQLWLVEGPGRVRRFGPPDVHERLAVAPDGERAAYLTSARGPAGIDGRSSEVWISHRDGERSQRLYALPANGRDERLLDLNWSSDGGHLLLASRQQLPGGGQSARLRILDPASGDARGLACLPSDIVAGSYVWSLGTSQPEYWLVRLRPGAER